MASTDTTPSLKGTGDHGGDIRIAGRAEHCMSAPECAAPQNDTVGVDVAATASERDGGGPVAQLPFNAQQLAWSVAFGR